MERKRKIALLALALILLCALLAGCQEQVEKHPLVAKWTERDADGRHQITFSFEAVGDAEMYAWQWDDEEGKLVQTEYYWGEYAVDDAAGTVALTLTNEDKDAREDVYTYETDGETLRLHNDEHDYTLTRAAENSANVK